MEIPDLVRQALGDEEIRAGVSLGDEDAACFTQTRTLVYRGEGLLSDEGVAEYSHEFERLALSEGRRKTKFRLEYVDGTEELAVPSDRTEAVLKLLLEGNLRAHDVLDRNETVSGVFRFSELTLVVSDKRLVKHIGEFTWDEDYEVYPFRGVTSLSFEDGSVATAVVLSVEGRPERIKAPNDQAPRVRQTLQQALFEFHGVDSLAALNREVGEEEPADDAAGDDDSGGLGFESGIDPLVSDSDDAANQASEDPPTGESGRSESDRGRPAGDRGRSADDQGQPAAGRGQSTGDGGQSASATETQSDRSGDETESATSSRQSAGANDRGQARSAGGSPSASGGQSADRGRENGTESTPAAVESDGEETVDPGSHSPRDADLKAISEQLAVLTEAVERQNHLLEEQRNTVTRLIEELRRGR